MLDLLTSLVDKSLVLYDEEDDRYRMLETIRQYAGERLQSNGEEEAARARHCAGFLRLAEEAAPRLRTPEQTDWLERLEREHDNFRAALAYALRAGCPCEGRREEESARGGEQSAEDRRPDHQPSTLSPQPPALCPPSSEAALRLAGALWEFWMIRGYFREGQGWLNAALERGRSASPALRAKAFSGAGTLAWAQGNFERATSWHEASLSLYQEAGDRRGVAFCLNNLAAQARGRGDYARACSLYGESLAHYRELGDRQGITLVLNNLGCLADDRGDYEAAEVFYEESLALAREAGDRRATSMTLGNLGEAARDRGDFARANRLLEESVALCREMGDRQGLVFSLDLLGTVAHRQGDSRRGAALCREGLAVARESGHLLGIAWALEGLAETLGGLGEWARAAGLLSAATALREALHMPRPPAERGDYERHVETLRAALGPDAFAAAWNRGRAMALEQAIEEALEEARSQPAA